MSHTVTHFISDLHLDSSRPGLEEILIRYLGSRAVEADRLFLLGDIFEVWMGDDLSMTTNADVCDALSAVSAQGVELFFMPGNRDFMIGEDFCKHTGCIKLPDPFIVDLNGRRALLSHGDMLCTDDIKHQEFRKLVTQESVQARLLSLPAEQRETMASQLRSMSVSGNSNKSADIMDVNQDTVINTMREHATDLLIHGHTHRCNIHNFMLDDHPAQRVVLSDWNENEGNLLVASDKQLAFEVLQ